MTKHFKIITDPNLALEIADKALSKVYTKNNNIALFKDINPEYIKKFSYNVATNAKGFEDYHIVGFYDDDELVGAMLFSEGAPWYNPNCVVFNEEFTVSFKEGSGIARRVADFLKKCLMNGLCTFIQTGSINDWCAPILYNTYTKLGFHTYNQYYLSKKDILEWASSAKLQNP